MTLNVLFAFLRQTGCPAVHTLIGVILPVDSTPLLSDISGASAGEGTGLGPELLRTQWNNE